MVRQNLEDEVKGREADAFPLTQITKATAVKCLPSAPSWSLCSFNFQVRRWNENGQLRHVRLMVGTYRQKHPHGVIRFVLSDPASIASLIFHMQIKG